MDTNIKYCPMCGSIVVHEIPDGDDRLRHICHSCGNIQYQNPKLVVGCIPEWERGILFCRRDIEPQKGKWTLPAGFMENNETAAEGAMRETWEETRAKVRIVAPYRVYDLPFVSQVYILFRAQMKDPRFKTTLESSEVRLINEEDVPWDAIAFPVIRETLKSYFEDCKRGKFEFLNLELKPERI
jgi:ADP-ribose pyrophosphatase YjhB (NUDIX family)